MLSGQARKLIRVSPGATVPESPPELSDGRSLGACELPVEPVSDAAPGDAPPDISDRSDGGVPEALNTPYTNSVATTMTSNAVKRILFLFICFLTIRVLSARRQNNGAHRKGPQHGSRSSS